MTSWTSSWVGTCETTGKRRYPTRRDAKRNQRRFARGMSAYRCEDCGDWHLGHLPKSVVQGRMGRADIEPREDA